MTQPSQFSVETVAPKIRKVTFSNPPVNVVGADTVAQLLEVVDGLSRERWRQRTPPPAARPRSRARSDPHQPGLRRRSGRALRMGDPSHRRRRTRRLRQRRGSSHRIVRQGGRRGRQGTDQSGNPAAGGRPASILGGVLRIGHLAGIPGAPAAVRHAHRRDRPRRGRAKPGRPPRHGQSAVAELSALRATVGEPVATISPPSHIAARAEIDDIVCAGPRTFRFHRA